MFVEMNRKVLSNELHQMKSEVILPGDKDKNYDEIPKGVKWVSLDSDTATLVT